MFAWVINCMDDSMDDCMANSMDDCMDNSMGDFIVWTTQ